jgi:acyl carrier protein
MTPTDSRTYETLVGILRKYSKPASANAIEPHALLDADLDINSARMIDIVLEVEDQFRITIEDAEMDGIRSVNDLIALIQAKTQGNRS